MKIKPEKLYLDLMKKCLTFSLWDEPPVSLDTFNYLRNPFKKKIISIVSKILKLKNLQIGINYQISDTGKVNRNYWSDYAHTMIGFKRLDNLQYCIETVLDENIKGDLVETGVWRGGACIFMRAVLAVYDIDDRKIYVADSFEGLPEPDTRYPADKQSMHHIHEYLSVSLKEVKENFRKYDLLDNQVIFVKGFFADTLPITNIENIAVLRLDGDMYSSTIDVLNNLYPKLSIGGFCIIDDYALKGCKKAVDDYRLDNSINIKLNNVDGEGVYWRKI